jgi:hypothetical protein
MNAHVPQGILRAYGHRSLISARSPLGMPLCACALAVAGALVGATVFAQENTLKKLLRRR